MRRNKRPTPQSKRDIRSVVFCGIGALLCLFSFKTMWLFFLLLVACAVARVFLYKKHKVTEAELEAFMDELENDGEEDESVPASIPRNVKMSKKELKQIEAERKKSYQNFLSDLEAELGDFDEEEDEEDEE